MMRVMIRFAASALALGLPFAPLHAAPTAISYDGVGFGRLSGYNPFNTLDNASAGLTVNLRRTTGGLVATDVVAETLGGKSFTLTEHGSQAGNSTAYLAGFSFNLEVPSYIQYVPSRPDERWHWIKDVPRLQGAILTEGPQVGATDASHFAMMPAGKYTLIFAGVVNLALGASSSFSGIISAVPLPGTLTMFAAALLCLTAFRRWHRPVTLTPVPPLISRA